MPLVTSDIITNNNLPVASDHLVYPWLLPGRLSLFVGVTNVGKTTLTLEFIAQMLKGDHLWDRFPCRRISSVLYLHAEHTLATLQEAAQARGDIPVGSVHVVHEFGSNGSALIVNEKINAALIHELDTLLAKLRPELIVAEPLSAFVGTSENSNSEVRTVVNILANLGAKYNAAVMAHHHTGKAVFDPERQAARQEGVATGEARGAMAFEDAAERVVYLHRGKDQTHIRLETPKAKGFPVSPIQLLFDEDTLSYEYVSNPMAERDLIAIYSRRRKMPSEPINETIEHFRTLWKCSPNRVQLLIKRARRVGLLE